MGHVLGLDPGLEGLGWMVFLVAVVGLPVCIELFLGLNVSIQHWRLNWSGFVSPLRHVLRKEIYFIPLPGRWRENKNLDGKNLD